MGGWLVGWLVGWSVSRSIGLLDGRLVLRLLLSLILYAFGWFDKTKQGTVKVLYLLFNRLIGLVWLFLLFFFLFNCNIHTQVKHSDYSIETQVVIF